MSILLLGLSPGTGDTVIERLSSQGDEVRVIEGDREKAQRWKALGARVAMGSASDADLIERAAQNSRTVVVFEGSHGATPVLDAALTGASQTSVDRLIVVTDGRSGSCLEKVRACSFDYVVLMTPNRRSALRRRAFAPGYLAEAIDAADDLSGHPRLELNLSDPDAALALRLSG